MDSTRPVERSFADTSNSNCKLLLVPESVFPKLVFSEREREREREGGGRERGEEREGGRERGEREGEGGGERERERERGRERERERERAQFIGLTRLPRRLSSPSLSLLLLLFSLAFYYVLRACLPPHLCKRSK